MRRLIAAGAYLDETSSLIDAPEIEQDRRQGGFVYAKIPRGSMTALHLAAREGQMESVRTLIEPVPIWMLRMRRIPPPSYWRP